MAMNVHGNPITVSTLRGMTEFMHKKEKKEEITRLDKARVALDLKNARGGDIHVCEFVAEIAKELPNDLNTYCLIYNATGDTLTFVSFKNWKGHIANIPPPVKIANGQWAAFVHINPSDSTDDSKGAVVYRGKNSEGMTECDFMFAWGNPHDDKRCRNVAFTQIGEKDSFEGDDKWKTIEEFIQRRTRENHSPVVTDSGKGCVASVSTGNGRKAFVEAIFTLEGADF